MRSLITFSIFIFSLVRFAQTQSYCNSGTTSELHSHIFRIINEVSVICIHTHSYTPTHTHTCIHKQFIYITPLLHIYIHIYLSQLFLSNVHPKVPPTTKRRSH